MKEAQAFAVARHSAGRLNRSPIPIRSIILNEQILAGHYRRPTRTIDGKLWDEISQAPMSTEFAISRFLVPHLVKQSRKPPYGLALFADCDILVRRSLTDLFHSFDNRYAVMCVKHNHVPTAATKMGGQVQTGYAKKNWSSVMIFNCDHPSNQALNLDLINTARGLHLHQFCWLKDEEIGEIGPEWNWLCGFSDPKIEPAIVHYTEGGPWLKGLEEIPYAVEWREELRNWAS